eukprot:7355030-Heterocapsa_arctica.AAC.1
MQHIDGLNDDGLDEALRHDEQIDGLNDDVLQQIDGLNDDDGFEEALRHDEQIDGLNECDLLALAAPLLKKCKFEQRSVELMQHARST